MATNVKTKIYSNDGSTLLFTAATASTADDSGVVTSTGFEFGVNYGVSTETYTYTGSKTFLGLASSANATEPEWAIGDTINPLGGGFNTFYIVEGESSTPTLTYDLTKLNLIAGTYNISIVAKADGYKNSVASEVVKFVVAEEPEDDTIVGTWLFNESISVNGGAWYNVNFTSNGVAYTAISDRRSQTSNMHDMTLRYFKNSTIYVYAFNGNGTWEDEAYRTITINEEPTDEAFITWLKANATKQEASTPVIKTFVYAQTQAFYSEPVHRQFEVGMTWSEFINSDYNVEQGLRPNYTEHVGIFIINSDGSVGFKGRMSADTSYQTISVFNGYGAAKTKSTDVVSSDITYTSSNIAGGGGN